MVKKKNYFLTVFLLYIFALLPVPSFSAEISKAVDLSGYMQFQYGFTQNDENSDTDQDGFKVAKARATIKGKPWESVSYGFQIDAAQAPKAIITDAYVGTSFLKPISIKAGQFKTPVSPSYLLSSTKWETILFPLAINSMTTKRDIGIQASGGFLEKKLNVAAGIFNGAGANNTNTDDSYLFAGQVGVNPVEYVELSGSIAYYDKDGDGKDEKALIYDGYLSGSYADAMLKFELMGKQAEEISTETETNSLGITVLAAYTIAEKIQPLVRFDWYEPDSDVEEDEKTRITGGINYFIQKHDLKIMANYVHNSESGESISDDQVLLMTQIIFK